MIIKKVYVTRTVRCKDGGSWSFQVEADLPEYDTESGKGKVIRTPHDFLQDLEALEDKLHHWLHSPEMAEKMQHSKTEW